LIASALELPFREEEIIPRREVEELLPHVETSTSPVSRYCVWSARACQRT